MIQKFTTKRDANGNRYTLTIDHNKKRFYPDYNTTCDYSEYITISKRDRDKLMEQAKTAGYSVAFRA